MEIKVQALTEDMLRRALLYLCWKQKAKLYMTVEKEQNIRG